jgi:hypothetical protein
MLSEWLCLGCSQSVRITAADCAEACQAMCRLLSCFARVQGAATLPRVSSMCCASPRAIDERQTRRAADQ